MSNSIHTKLRTIVPDSALRVGQFDLLPNVELLPAVLSEPYKNVFQNTWIRSYDSASIVYQHIAFNQPIIRAVKDTTLNWAVVASDPSITNDPASALPLSYFWRKNSAPLVELNNSNFYQGSPSVLIEKASVEDSGQYVCEVHNQYGVTETTPLVLDIIDTKKHPKLYSNLLLNGNADSQLDGWTSDSDIISQRFSNSVFVDQNFGSIPANDIWYEFNLSKPSNIPQEFRFSQNSYGYSLPGLLYPWVSSFGDTWQSVDPGWMYSRVPSSGQDILPVWNQWVLFTYPPQIIANEDGLVLNQPLFNGFFPGMLWIDKYNRNDSPLLVGLLPESQDQTLSYFTRDKLKFLKYGGKASSQFTQRIDLSELADLIDGKVYGVDYASSQFFAYVGAGISRYKIKATTTKGVELFNWNIVDSEDFFTRITTSNNAVKKALVGETVIEIIPLVEDTTQVEVKYYNQNDQLLSSDLISGPSNQDVFAIKEKAFLPISLYPLFEFFVTNNNPIQLFGQTYTNTQAIQALFDEQTPFPQNQTDQELNLESTATVADGHGSFLLKKFGFMKWNGCYPVSDFVEPNRSNRSIRERGAAAMFGVEKTRTIPRQARYAEVTVRFTHTSEVIADQNPRIKGWSSHNMYYEGFGQNRGSSVRPAEYGYPRCGITKMKFIVVPNNFKIEPDFVSYKLPPSVNTILGLQKQALFQDTHNTANRDQFVYQVEIPTNPSPYEGAINPLLAAAQESELAVVAATQSTSRPTTDPLPDIDTESLENTQ